LNGSGTAQPNGSNYEEFYGLAQPPFALSPDPRFLYLSPAHDTVIRQLLRAIQRKEAFVILSGEIGTGKTTICRALVNQLDRTVFPSLILNPFLTVDELLRQVLIDFGVVSIDAVREERFTRASRHELSIMLQAFLRTLEPIGATAVLIVDEAQHLSAQVLEELRLFSGQHTPGAPALQIVLVGQPTLLDAMTSADLRQLDQRVSLRALVEPLRPGDVAEYIAHRLTVAGESVSVAFDRKAVARVHELSGGVPRAINLLCDRALALGAARGVHEITPDLVERAADALALRRLPQAPNRTRRAAVAIAIGCLALAGVVTALAFVTPIHRVVAAPMPTLPDAPPGVPPVPLPRLPQDWLHPIDIPVPTAGDVPDDFVAPR
jgi:general secretion pathway protein A